MSGKRNKKKLAKQQNNASLKLVPPQVAKPGRKVVSSEAINPSQYRDLKVRWTAREMDPLPSDEDGRRWDLSAEETQRVLKFLDEVSQKTWGECLTEMDGGRNKTRARNHDHEISELAPAARKRIEELPTAEERIFRFRLGAKARLWGFRSYDLFRVLWWDPEHQVYPTLKRNT